MLTLINPVERAEPFNHADWLPADLAQRQPDAAVRAALDLLPKGRVFDGEPVVLDDAGWPLFDELLFGHGRPIYVAFDLLVADGVDLRPLPLRERKAALARLGEGAEG